MSIILNFQEVAETDSTGLGALVFGLARLHKAGGRLVLLNVNDTHLKMFLLTQLAIAFEFSEHEQNAVDSFLADRAWKHHVVPQFAEHKNERTSKWRFRAPSAC